MAQEPTGVEDAIVVSQTPAIEPEKVDAPAEDGTAPAPQENKPERVFTQQELDAKTQARVAKEQRKYDRIINDLEAKLAKAASVQTDSVKAVSREDFESYEDYVAAKAVAAAETYTRKKEAEQYEAAQKWAAEHRQSEFSDRLETRKSEGRAKYDDFDEVTSAEVPLNVAMANAIAESDNGHDLAYYFGKNPQDAERIAGLTPVLAAIAIGKLSVKLEGEKASKRVSSAAAPISPVDTGTASNDSSEPSPKDPIDVWMRKREEQLAKQRRR